MSRYGRDSTTQDVADIGMPTTDQEQPAAVSNNADTPYQLTRSHNTRAEAFNETRSSHQEASSSLSVSSQGHDNNLPESTTTSMISASSSPNYQSNITYSAQTPILRESRNQQESAILLTPRQETGLPNESYSDIDQQSIFSVLTSDSEISEEL